MVKSSWQLRPMVVRDRSLIIGGVYKTGGGGAQVKFYPNKKKGGWGGQKRF